MKRWLFSVALSAMTLMSCGEKLTVEQQVIGTLRHMESAAEDGRHLDFMENVSDNFSAQQGSMGRLEFHRFMIFQINQHRRLQAQFFPIFVTETGEGSASAHFRLLVTGGAGLLPESGQLFEVETQWIRDGGDWLLQEANWEAVRLPDLGRDQAPN